MDIGCNAGLVTLRACSRFLCASVVGVDIDRTLVQKAVRALCTARDQVANWHKTGTCEPAVVQSASLPQLLPRPAATKPVRPSLSLSLIR